MHKKQYSKKKPVHYQEPLDNRTATQLLEDQLLVLKLIHEKLSVLQYLRDAEGEKKTIIENNVYTRYMSDVLYKSLIIDYVALFGGDRKQEKNSLQMFYTDTYNNSIDPEKLSAIRSAMSRYKPIKNPIKRLTNLRDKEVNHFDTTSVGNARVTIRINWELVEIMEELFKIAQKVIGIGMDIPEDSFNATDKVAGLDAMVTGLIKG